MTETQTRIVQLFKTLPPTEQRALVEQLDESIAQAERGETVPAAEVFDRIAKRFVFSNA